MNMQIISVCLYNSKTGDIRKLDFKLNKLNIIAGAEKTGKSAIIPIIDYCFGSSNLEIRSGVVTDTVGFYAVLYQLSDRQIFIAKPAPQQGRKQNKVYYEEGSSITVPENSNYFDKLEYNDDYVIKKLSFYLGIKDNYFSVRSTAVFLFQDKSIIDNKDRIFDHFFEKTDIDIKNSLLYFLKIADSDDRKIRIDLDNNISELRKLKRDISAFEDERKKEIIKGNELVDKAKQLGLIAVNFYSDDLGEIVNNFKEIIRMDLQKNIPMIPDEIDIFQLEEDIKKLRSDLRDIDRQINELQSINLSFEGYSEETNEQISRLKSIDLFDKNEDLFRQNRRCPLCCSELGNPIPDIGDIKNILVRLEEDLRFETEIESPNLNKMIKELKDKRAKLNNAIKNKKTVLQKNIDEKNIVEQLLNLNNEKNKVLHNIDYYVENVDEASTLDLLSMKNKKELLERDIALAKEQLDQENMRNRKESTFRWLSYPMKDWAEVLGLEDSGSIYHFDFDKLTILADRKGFSIEMGDMRGHSNWIGCHLLAFLALHKAFLELNSSVPSFLIFDQPNFETPELVSRLFDFLVNGLDDIKSNIQIIVTTHDDFGNHDKIKENLVESYWTGKDKLALIPEQWI